VDSLLRTVTRNLGRPGYMVVYGPLEEGYALYLNFCWPSGLPTKHPEGTMPIGTLARLAAVGQRLLLNARQKMSDLVGTVLA
jgi:hypothetical protein